MLLAGAIRKSSVNTSSYRNQAHYASHRHAPSWGILHGRFCCIAPARIVTHSPHPAHRPASERATARTLLLDEAVPLLTLTGPGGVGKTRLALTVAQDVADQFADGVVWVDLAPLRDADLVPAAVAGALGIVPGPNRPAWDLAHHLRPQQTLLVLDNCEHLLAAIAALVATLLASCPALQILARAAPHSMSMVSRSCRSNPFPCRRRPGQAGAWRRMTPCASSSSARGPSGRASP